MSDRWFPDTTHPVGRPIIRTRKSSPIWLAPLVIAVALRLWSLDAYPAPLLVDEARLGNDAWSIVRTGASVTQAWPAPARFLSTYAVAVSMGVLGPTAFAVRLPFAIAGAVSVVPATIIGHRLFGTHVAGTAAGVFLAISPWHLTFTRLARDGTWLVLGLLVMVAGLISAAVRDDDDGRRVTAASWSAGIRDRFPRLTSPNPTQSLVLTVFGALVAVLGESFGAVAAGTTALALVIAFAATHASCAHSAPSKPGASKSAPRGTGAPGASTEPNPFKSPRLIVAVLLVAVVALTGRSIAIGPEDPTSASATAIAARRVEANGSGLTGALQAPWAVRFRGGLNAYASHFDLTFLFTRGDNDRRNHASGFGQCSLAELPLVVGGGLLAVRRAWSQRSGRSALRPWAVVVAWLAVAPLPAAFAISSGDAARSIGMVPAIALLEAGTVAALWPRVVRRGVTLEAKLILVIATVAWMLATAVHDPIEGGWVPAPREFIDNGWAHRATGD